MTSFFGELRRRNVFKVAVAYLIVGWLLMEVASVMGPALNLPDWTTSFVAFLLILGFPVALVLSWAYELTPEGVKKTRSVPLSESVTHITGRKLDFVIIAVLVLAVAFFVVERSVLDESDSYAGAVVDPGPLNPAPDEPLSAGASAAPYVPAAAPAEPQRQPLPNSVAVLPFENLSPDPSNAYFAAGIHEEILNQLVKLRNLSVISRTSVLRYEGSELSIPQIASELNVETVMEGSVRYSGDRVRIAAQLIDAETDEHLWSEIYERGFADVFGIQADIAMNIANAVGAEFSPDEQASIERQPTTSAAAYALYLDALAKRDAGSAIWRDSLGRAIELDPDFALAFARRAYLNTWEIVGLGGLSPDQTAEFERRIREDAERALELDPTLGIAEAALAVLHQVNWRGAAAERAFQRALELNPNDADVLVMYGRFKRYRNEHAEGIRLMRRAIELDPNNPIPRNLIAIQYRDAADWVSSSTAYRDWADRAPTEPGTYAGIALAEAALGNREEALRNLDIAAAFDPNEFRLAQMAHAYALLDRHDDVLRLLASLQEIAAERPVGDALWASVYIAAGDYEQALRRLEAAIDNRMSIDFATLAYISANPWRYPELERPEFQALLSRLWDEE